MLVLVLAAALALALPVGCSGEGDASGRSAGDGAGQDRAAGQGSGSAGSSEGDGLGHQAFQPSTRLVVPAEEGEPLDRSARVLAGLSEGPLGTRLFVDQRPGEGGRLAWRDVANEEPDGHQVAYVSEGLLAPGAGSGDLEMVAQTDVGFAVLVVKGDPEVETLQWGDFETFGELVEAAREDPGFVEIADHGAGTVYRAGTLALERESGLDLSPKSPANKSPIQAIYDAEVEAALVPLDGQVLTDVWAGELEALAVFGEARSKDLPSVPTTGELSHEVSVPVFGGVAAPAGTPLNVVDELGRAFVASASSRTFARALVGTGRQPAQRGPEDFAEYIEKQSDSSSQDPPE